MDTTHNNSLNSQGLQSKDNQFSVFFPPISNTKNHTDTTLSEVYKDIKSDIYKYDTVEIRKLQTKDERNVLKTTRLKAACFSGTFKTRNAKGLINHSGLICVDIDHVNDLESLKANILAKLDPALMFVSPSGDGLKIVYRIDILNHKHIDYYNALEVFFHREFDFLIDKQCKDIPRTCFLCFDPSAYFNNNAPILVSDFIVNNKKPLSVKKEVFTKGKRNKHVNGLVYKSCRGGKSEEDALNEVKGFAEEGFEINEIEAIVKSVYSNVSSIKADVSNYIRVGTAYFKVEKNNEFTVWNRQTLIDDFGKDSLSEVAKYSKFTVDHNFINYSQIIDDKINLSQPLKHLPLTGECNTILNFLNHVFGEQIELGLDYFQLLYLKPNQILPILCLVSKERHTGKTTFIDFLRYIFGKLAVQINQKQLKNEFNSNYATALITTIDESKIISTAILEELKNLSTSETINIRRMHTDHMEIPFFGKIVLCSNHVDSFVNVDEEEIRYWVRELNTVKNDNNFKQKLKDEIPAFLHYLQNREMHVKTPLTRMYFSPEMISTKQLDTLKMESHSKEEKNLASWLAENYDGFASGDFAYVKGSDLADYVFGKRSGTNEVAKMIKKLYGVESGTHRGKNAIPSRCYKIPIEHILDHPLVL